MNEEHERARQIVSLTAIAAIILLIVVFMASCIPATYNSPVCTDRYVGYEVDENGNRTDRYEFQCR